MCISAGDFGYQHAVTIKGCNEFIKVCKIIPQKKSFGGKFFVRPQSE
jgi:hypothetical protein